MLRAKALGKVDRPRRVRLSVIVTEGKARCGWSIRCRHRGVMDHLLELIRMVRQDTIQYSSVHALTRKIIDMAGPPR